MRVYSADGDGVVSGDFSADDDFNVDYYVLNPTFSIGDNLTINPVYMGVYSKDASAWGKFDSPFAGPYQSALQDEMDAMIGPAVEYINDGIAAAIANGSADDYIEDQLNTLLGIGTVNIPEIPDVAFLKIGLDITPKVSITDTSMNYLGLNLDFAFDGGGVWFTGIYQFGKLDYEVTASGTLTETIGATGGPVTISDTFDQDITFDGVLESDSVDVKAYLLALGGNLNLGGADVHGQVFYATGQDLTDDSEDDITAFTAPRAGPTTGLKSWVTVPLTGRLPMALVLMVSPTPWPPIWAHPLKPRIS